MPVHSYRVIAWNDRSSFLIPPLDFQVSRGVLDNDGASDCKARPAQADARDTADSLE